MKLNVGCGKDIKKGWVNLDFIRAKGVDKTHDLNKFPYPFDDDSFDEIYASHIIEHVEDPEKFMQELWRIGKINGKIKIITPHFSCGPLSWGDLTHKRTFSSLAFYNYDLSKKKLGINSLASLNKMTFSVKIKITFGKLHKKMGLQKLFNKFISVYENFFAYIFPAREIIFELTIKK